ncbi:uncharacterized protein [Battus philenor]|uniref:uncharacterized protein n=1 Tax=Battus philenor TaxID=42288 RepID=UPI0035D017AE
MLSVNNYRRTGPGLSLNYINQLALENFLENELQMFLYPLNFTRYILFSNRYSICCNFITPNNRKANCCSFICSICYVFIYGYAIHVDNIYKNTTESLLSAIHLINHFIYIFICILNSILNATKSEANVDIILKIQRLQKSIKLDKINYKGLIFVNWIYILSICSFYIFLSILHIYLKNISITLVFSYITLLLLDSNIIYLIRVNKLLVYSIDSWMSELKRLDGKCWNDGIEDAVGYKQHLVRFNDVVKTFLEILEGSIIYRNLIEIPARDRCTKPCPVHPGTHAPRCPPTLVSSL